MRAIEKEVLKILAAAKINGWIEGKKKSFVTAGFSREEGRKVVLEAIHDASEQMLTEMTKK